MEGWWYVCMEVVNYISNHIEGNTEQKQASLYIKALALADASVGLIPADGGHVSLQSKNRWITLPKKVILPVRKGKSVDR